MHKSFRTATNLKDLVPVRLIAQLAAFLGVIVVAGVAARILVPAAPSPGHQWIVLKNLLLPLLTLWAYRYVVVATEHREPSEIAFRGSLKHALSGAAVGAGLIAAFVATLWALGFATLAPGDTAPGLMPAVNEVVVPAVTAIGEELLFRAIIFRLIEQMAGTAAALWISSALFGLAHLGNPGADITSVLALGAGMGVLLASAYAATRSLWCPVALHFAWNFTEGAVFGFPNSGQLDPARWMQTTLSGPVGLSGGTFGPEGSMFLLAISWIVAWYLWNLARRRGHWVDARFTLRANSSERL